MPMDPLAQERPAGNKKIYMYFLIFLVDSRGSGWLGDGHAYLGRGGEKGGGVRAMFSETIILFYGTIWTFTPGNGEVM